MNRPQQYAVVPRDPSEEMVAAAHAGDEEYTRRSFGDLMTVMQGPHDHYVAMIAAAPPPPEQVLSESDLSAIHQEFLGNTEGYFGLMRRVEAAVLAKFKESAE